MRALYWWAIVHATAVVTRTAADWYVPPESFHARSTVSTWVSIVLFVIAGCWIFSQTRSLSRAALGGGMIAGLSALFSLAGISMMLAFDHEPATLAAIARSGGLWEAYELPIMMCVPAMILSLCGATIWKIATSRIIASG